MVTNLYLLFESNTENLSYRFVELCDTILQQHSKPSTKCPQNVTLPARSLCYFLYILHLRVFFFKKHADDTSI
jgi:hypothetical protein